MAVEDKRPRLFQRLFHHKSVSAEASSSQRPLPGRKTSNATTAEKQEKGSSTNVNRNFVEESVSYGLWSEVYNSFTASTGSPDLQAVAKLLREQSTTPFTAKNSDSDAKASREWHLCREILHMAETKKSELGNSAEKPLMRQMRHAYDEIITWTQKFVVLGDIVSQVDPVHIGLPWAGIRAVLIVRTSLLIQVQFRSYWLLLRLLSMIRKRKPKSLPELHIFLG